MLIKAELVLLGLDRTLTKSNCLNVEPLNRSGYKDPDEIDKNKVGEEEVRVRLRQPDCCLVGWWGGAVALLLNLNTLGDGCSSWEVVGSLNEEELGRGL